MTAQPHVERGDSTTRRYHLRWVMPVNVGMTIFWAVLWLLMALGPAKGNWFVLGVLGGFLCVISVWAILLPRRAGVREFEHGIAVTSMFLKTERLYWSDLQGFEHQRRGTHDLVYARRTDGSRVRLLNVLQGQRVLWGDGETRDIVGVMNGRLQDRLTAGREQCGCVTDPGNGSDVAAFPSRVSSAE